MMLTDQKENLHEICAQWYEKHHKGNANYQSVIMHHWMRSGNTHKKARRLILLLLLLMLLLLLLSSLTMFSHFNSSP